MCLLVEGDGDERVESKKLMGRVDRKLCEVVSWERGMSRDCQLNPGSSEDLRLEAAEVGPAPVMELGWSHPLEDRHKSGI